MKMTLDQSDFVNAFRNAGRGEQFSYAAFEALFEHLEDTNPEYELDVIGLCCEWTEYDSAAEAASGYDWEPDENEDEEENEESALEYLKDRTTVIEFTGGILIQDF